MNILNILKHPKFKLKVVFIVLIYMTSTVLSGSIRKQEVVKAGYRQHINKRMSCFIIKIKD